MRSFLCTIFVALDVSLLRVFSGYGNSDSPGRSESPLVPSSADDVSDMLQISTERRYLRPSPHEDFPRSVPDAGSSLQPEALSSISFYKGILSNDIEQ